MPDHQFNNLDKCLAQRKKEGALARPSVVVASVFQTGLNLMRDLEEKGICAIGIDADPTNPGFRSKYGVSLLCPNPDQEPQAWLEFMIDLSSAIGEKPVLIAASDLFVTAIGRHANTLKEYFIFSEAGSVLQATLSTKEKQYALAREHGLPCPRSTYVETLEELEEFAAEARFPVLVKPRSHREWVALPDQHPLHGRKTISSNCREELVAIYQSVRQFVPQAVLQEEIVGPDSDKYCYLSVYARDGHRLGACVVRELRAYPLLYGCATLVEPVIDEEIDRVCNQFLLSLGFVGLCEIELKRDARDGRLLLIEVNPRFSGTGDCSRYTGVETGYIHYLDLIGQTPGCIKPTKFDFRHMMLVADITAFPVYLSQGQITWGKWIKSLSGQLKFFDFDLRDFKNARITAIRAMRALAGGLLRHHGLRK
jgi:predicted ATP-grasp superfamily ATP-dependent carboligase